MIIIDILFKNVNFVALKTFNTYFNGLIISHSKGRLIYDRRLQDSGKNSYGNITIREEGVEKLCIICSSTWKCNRLS